MLSSFDEVQALKKEAAENGFNLVNLRGGTTRIEETTGLDVCPHTKPLSKMVVCEFAEYIVKNNYKQNKMRGT